MTDPEVTEQAGQDAESCCAGDETCCEEGESTCCG